MDATRNIDGQIYFLNLPGLVAGGLQAAKGTGIGWISFEHELNDFTCVGLATGALSPAAELTLDLGLTGWHRLHVAHSPAIRIWLDGDTGYCEVPGDPSIVRDYALPAADYTGRRLHIAPVRGAERSQELILHYLRAEPCTGPAPNHRNLVATNDGHGVFWAGMDTPRDIYRHLYPFRDSDFFRMLWGVYGGGPLNMRPDSTVSEIALHSDETNFYANEWVFNRSLRRMQTAGADPLAVVRDATRETGLELHYYFRVAAFFGPFPHMGWTARLFAEHPEWRCRDEFGHEVNRISYAYPPVREYILAYFEELLDYEPDGLCLAFNRGLPLMICEEPVIEAFQRKHGRAPHLPEEADSPELLAVRHELLADFVERAHRLVASRGKVLSCIVPRDFARNRLYGLDLELLIGRGLLESVMVGAGHRDDPALNADLAPLQELRAPGTKVYAGGSRVPAHGAAWVPGDLQARARHMAAILDAGLDGGYFWDTEHVIGLEWEAMRRFGDRAILERIISGEWPAPAEHTTLRIHGTVDDRYNPWNAL